LAKKLRLLSKVCFTTQICRPPQGRGPLPVTGEALSLVVLPREYFQLGMLPEEFKKKCRAEVIAAAK
jgi:hypothetical protein